MASWFNVSLMHITTFYVVGSLISAGLRFAQETEGFESIKGWWLVFFPFVPCAIVCLGIVLYRTIRGDGLFATQKAKSE